MFPFSINSTRFYVCKCRAEYKVGRSDWIWKMEGSGKDELERKKKEKLEILWVSLYSKKKRKREANIVIPPFCVWMEWRYGSLASSRCLLLPFHVRRRANSSRPAARTRPSKCSWPIDDDRPDFLGCRRTTPRCNMHTYSRKESNDWCSGTSNNRIVATPCRDTAVSNSPGVCVSCQMGRVGLPAEIGLGSKRWNLKKYRYQMDSRKRRWKCAHWFFEFLSKNGARIVW